MILDAPSSAALGSALSGAPSWEPVVTSWLGARHLARVPVARGRVQWSTRREVQGSVDLTVPRWADGRDWRPGADTEHPLARYGQVLRVAVRVSVGRRSWTIPQGVFLVQRTEPSAGDVRVSGVSMMRRAVGDAFVSPRPSSAGSNFAQEMRRVCPASLSLAVDDSLPVRSVPEMSWATHPLDALYELAAAWPALLREDAWGDLVVRPTLDGIPDPLDTLTDGEGGTVVDAYESDDRVGTFNRIVVRGQDTSATGLPAVQQVVEQTSGPFSVLGDYGVETETYSSALATSPYDALVIGRARLADSLRQARTIPVTLAPDPRWQLDDAVEVLADGQRWWGWVSGVDLPLTVADGDMRMDVEVPS